MYKIIPLLFLIVGCVDHPDTPSDDEFTDWVAKRYVTPFKQGDVERWLEAFADDAVGMHHTLPALVGVDGIRGFGNTVHENLVVDIYEVSVDDVRVADPWAYTRGTYRTRFLPQNHDGEVPPPTVGKFVLLWERQADGTWKIVLDMGNQDTPCGYAECG